MGNRRVARVEPDRIRRPGETDDDAHPSAASDDEHEVRFVQPYQAVKRYRCPGCDQEMPVGMGHVVVVPRDAPDLRRHWHVPCWQARTRRRPRSTS